jgi:hypothetical protein
MWKLHDTYRTRLCITVSTMIFVHTAHPDHPSHGDHNGQPKRNRRARDHPTRGARGNIDVVAQPVVYKNDEGDVNGEGGSGDQCGKGGYKERHR